jgi:hypothetical protein
VTTVDDETLEKLIDAKEDDLYLSDVSPLGVPFNSLKGNTKDSEKESLIVKGRPGSSCLKNFVLLNKEFGGKSIYVASHQYQHLKLLELDSQLLSEQAYRYQHDKIVEKACICAGLGTSALLANGLDTKVEGKGISICPGPNLAFFSSKMSLR